MLTVGDIAPILKKVYPEEAPAVEKKDHKRKRRFSKIRTTLKNKTKRNK